VLSWFVGERSTWLSRISSACLTTLPVSEAVGASLSLLLLSSRGVGGGWDDKNEAEGEDQIEQAEVEALLQSESTEMDNYLTDVLGLPSLDDSDENTGAFSTATLFEWEDDMIQSFVGSQ
jgi:hypothetical protein